MATKAVNSTKAYTLNKLISEVSNISRSNGSTVDGVYTALSPRAGASSYKFTVINRFLNGKLSEVLGNHASVSPLTRGAKTPRSRLLNALRARKRSS